MRNKTLVSGLLVGLITVFLVSLYINGSNVSKHNQNVSTPLVNKTDDSNSVKRIQQLEDQVEHVAGVLEDIANQLNNTNSKLALLSEQKEIISDQHSSSQNNSGHDKKTLTPEEVAALKQSQIDRLEEEFHSEPINSSWNGAAEASINDLFVSSDSEVFLKTQIDQVECRQKSCKITVYHDDDMDPEDFEIEFFRKMAEMGMGRIRGYQTNVDDKKKSYFYTSPNIQSELPLQGIGSGL